MLAWVGWQAGSVDRWVGEGRKSGIVRQATGSRRWSSCIRCRACRAACAAPAGSALSLRGWWPTATSDGSRTKGAIEHRMGAGLAYPADRSLADPIDRGTYAVPAESSPLESWRKRQTPSATRSMSRSCCTTCRTLAFQWRVSQPGSAISSTFAYKTWREASPRSSRSAFRTNSRHGGRGVEVVAAASVRIACSFDIGFG